MIGPMRDQRSRTIDALFGRWAPTVAWVILPLLAGDPLGGALDDRSRAVQLVASIGLWALWALGLLAALVAVTASLTVLRLLAPAGLAVTLWAAGTAAAGSGAAEWLASGWAALTTVIVFAAPVGEAMVNGSAYGDERRFPLRPPGLLLLGPIPLVGAITVIAFTAPVLLLASEHWMFGIPATVVGLVIGVTLFRRLHRLSTRWFVFVPAGVVLVDPFATTDSVLAQRHRIASLGVAGATTSAVDLTQGSLGLGLELEFTDPEPIVAAPTRRTRQAVLTPTEVSGIVFAPSRPGRVLAEATARRVPTR